MNQLHVHRVKSARVLLLRGEPVALANCKSRVKLTIDSCMKLRFSVRLRARQSVSPYASLAILRLRNSDVTSITYFRTEFRSRISYEIPRAHIKRASSLQLSLRENFCDVSLCRVIARFPLHRLFITYLSLDRVVYMMRL